MKISEINEQLKDGSPEEIMSYFLDLYKDDCVTTTNFSVHEAAILWCGVSIHNKMRVIWIDSGYNTSKTYEFAKNLIDKLKLNIQVYTPAITTAYRNTVLNGVPGLDDTENHKIFTEEVKLEPFRRAFADVKPKVWFTLLRKEQTPEREKMDIVTLSKDNIIKVSPFFYFSEEELEEYIVKNNLPMERDYFDPTKVDSKRECGLHL